jgi:hypothetical protein
LSWEKKAPEGIAVPPRAWIKAAAHSGVGPPTMERPKVVLANPIVMPQCTMSIGVYLIFVGKKPI